MANMYGPDNGVNRCFATWMRERFEQRVAVPLYGDQFRSFLWVGDAVKALLELAGRCAGGEIYNLGGTERASRVEFGVAFARAFGFDQGLIQPISINDDGLGHLRGADGSLDVGKVQGALSFRLKGIRGGLAAWKDGTGH